MFCCGDAMPHPAWTSLGKRARHSFDAACPGPDPGPARPPNIACRYRQAMFGVVEKPGRTRPIAASLRKLV